MCFADKMMKKSGAAVAVLLAVSLALCGCGKKQEQTAMTEVPETVQAQTTAATETHATQDLVIESTEEQGDMVVVTTSFGQVKYPFAFADLIQVRAVNEGTVASLEFTALIAQEEYPLFAVRFGGSEGIPLGTLEIPGEAEPRAVCAEFYSVDESALGDHAGTFFAAQETFNDVVASLYEIQAFAAAK